jgi:uracil phosphoribosyltransferase
MQYVARKRVPNIIVHYVEAVVNDETMEEHCIIQELPEFIEDYQIEFVDGLHVVVLGTIEIDNTKYHVINVERDHNGEEAIYILKLVRAE